MINSNSSTTTSTPNRYEIKSFTQYGIEKMLNSEILYPSNCVTRRITDKGNLPETLKMIDIFKRQEKNWFNTLAMKPIRIVARATYVLGVTLILAPAGVVYHGVKFTQHRFSYHRDSEAIARHRHALKMDFLATLSGIMAVALPMIDKLAMVLDPELIVAFGILGFGSILLQGMAPLEMVRFFTPYDKGEKIGLYKSILLKNDFGLVAEDGSLLKYQNQLGAGFTEDKSTNLESQFVSRDERKTGDFEGTFGRFYEISADEFLEAIRLLQMELPRSCRIPFHYPPNGRTIIQHLKEKQKNGQLNWTTEKLNNWIRDIQEKEEKVNTFEAHIRKICEMEYDVHPLFDGLVQRVHLKSFPFPISARASRAYFSGLRPKINAGNANANVGPDLAQKNFEVRLKDALEAKANIEKEEEKPEKLKEVADRVKPDMELYEILGFTSKPTDQSEIRKAYLKLLFLHQDKHELNRIPPSLKTSATALFTLVTLAYEKYYVKK